MTRIIGGSHRGHRLSMPKGDRTRPTTDRVREALFSALASWCGDPTGPPDQALAGVAFLDLYAGSGAVGLEAASRGAGPVVLVESDRRTALVASGNAKALGLAVSVRATKVETVIAEPVERRFGVVFADPPYEVASDLLDHHVAVITEQLLDHHDGLIVLERSTRSVPPAWPAALDRTWHRSYGETTLHFATREDTP